MNRRRQSDQPYLVNTRVTGGISQGIEYIYYNIVAFNMFL